MKYQALRPQFFTMGEWGVVGWVGVAVGRGGVVVGWVAVGRGGVVQSGGGVVGGVIRLSF